MSKITGKPDKTVAVVKRVLQAPIKKVKATKTKPKKVIK